MRDEKEPGRESRQGAPWCRGTARWTRVAWLCWLGAGLFALVPAPALALCEETGANGNRTQITCSGDDPDGFDAAGEGNLDLSVEQGATLSNAAGQSTLSLNGVAGSDAVLVEGDTLISNDAAGRAGIELTGIASTLQILEAPLDENGDPLPEARIEVSGAGGAAILAGDFVAVDSAADLAVDAADGVGVRGGDNNIVTNRGTIDVSGDSGIGIEVGDLAQVANEGEIFVTGDDAVGIRVGENNFFSPAINNRGAVEVTGTGAIGFDVGERNQLVQGVTGRLTVVGDDAIGVRLLGGSTLTNRGTVDASGFDGIAVRVAPGGVTGNTISNRGTLLGGGGAGVALHLGDSAAGTINIVENLAGASIEVPDGPGEVPRVAILGGAGLDQVANAGTILGHVELGAGDDTYTAVSGGSVDGDIRGGVGSDTFALGGTGEVAEPFDLSRPLEFERFEQRSATWTLSGSGIFVDGFEATGGVTRILDAVTVTADATHAESSTLEIHTRPSALGSLGEFRVTGGYTIEPGVLTDDEDTRSTLRVVANAPFTEPEAGVPLVRATGGITGSFGAVELPENTAGFGFRIETVLGGIGIDLIVESIPLVDSAVRPNQRRVASYLDAARALETPSGDFAVLLSELDILSPAAFARAANALHAEPYDAHTATAVAVGRLFAASALAPRPRCEDVRYRYQPGIVSKAPCGERGYHVWVDAIGDVTQRDADSGHVDYDRALGGVVLGADVALGDAFLVTGYVGGSSGTLDIEGIGDGKASSIDVGVAGLANFAGAELRGVLGYGHGFHEQERRIVLGTTVRNADGDYGSDRFLTTVELAYPLRWQVFELSPLAALDYTHVTEESFDESGAGAASLDVKERNNDIFGGRIGLRAGATLFKYRYIAEWLEWANGVWRPEVHVAYRRVFTGADRDLEARLSGATPGSGDFEVSGEDAEQGLEVGLRTGFQPFGTGVHLDAGVDVFLGDGNMEAQARAQVRVPF